MLQLHMGLDVRKPVFGGLRTTKLQTSLCICEDWSAPLLFFMKSVISELATGEISISQLVFVAEETGLSLALLETRKTGFVTTKPI